MPSLTPASQADLLGSMAGTSRCHQQFGPCCPASSAHWFSAGSWWVPAAPSCRPVGGILLIPSQLTKLPVINNGHQLFS